MFIFKFKSNKRAVKRIETHIAILPGGSGPCQLHASLRRIDVSVLAPISFNTPFRDTSVCLVKNAAVVLLQGLTTFYFSLVIMQLFQGSATVSLKNYICKMYLFEVVIVIRCKILICTFI